jgi:phosphatidylinositol alpha-1,6-mannosyltransferase
MYGRQALTIASQTFLGPRGGISRVCDLTARVAIETGFPLALLSVENEGGAYQHSESWKGCGGSRSKFVAACALAALRGNHIWYDQLGTARAHALTSKISRPCAVWIHGIEVWEQLRRDRLRAAHRAGFMVANTHYTRDRAIRHDKVFESAEVCWLATSQDEPPEIPANLAGPPVVFILGRLDEAAYKGHRELIEAWPEVVKGVPEARLVIAGSGPLIERYRSMAASSKTAKYIDIIGFVTESMLADLWKRTVVFAMPSRGEGFGLAYIEAMRYGIPVIASVHDAGAEVSIHNETGLNVDLSRPGDLADSIVELLRDRDLATRLGSAGQLRWRKYFCYSAFRTRFSELLGRFVKL